MKKIAQEESIKPKHIKNIINAVIAGDIKSLQKILSKQTNFDINFNNSHLLKLSILNGHLKMVQYLFDQGIKVKLVNNDEENLIWLICFCSLEMVQCIYMNHPDKKIIKNFLNKQVGAAIFINWMDKYDQTKELEEKLGQILPNKDKDNKKIKV